MTSEIEYQCNNCGHEGINTRAVPDVPELVRYDLACDFDGNYAAHIVEVELGDYVRYDQAAEIIAAKDAQWQRSEQDKVGMLQHINELIELAEAAEADRDHWMANHDNMSLRNAVLSQRPDLPADRLPAIQRYERMIAVKDKEIEQAKKEINTLLVSYVREHFFENKTFQPLDSLMGQISQLDNAITITRDFKNRAEAVEAKNKELEDAWLNAEGKISDLEAKLAQMEKQEAVAYLQEHPNHEGEFTHADNEAHRLTDEDKKYGWGEIPLYAAPVPAPDLKAENEKLRDVIENITCPRPCNGRPDDTTVKQCISYGECACVYGSTLKGESNV